MKTATAEPFVVTNAACPRCDGPVHFTPARGVYCAAPYCGGTAHYQARLVQVVTHAGRPTHGPGSVPRPR